MVVQLGFLGNLSRIYDKRGQEWGKSNVLLLCQELIGNSQTSYRADRSVYTILLSEFVRTIIFMSSGKPLETIKFSEATERLLVLSLRRSTSYLGQSFRSNFSKFIFSSTLQYSSRKARTLLLPKSA